MVKKRREKCPRNGYNIGLYNIYLSLHENALTVFTYITIHSLSDSDTYSCYSQTLNPWEV